MEKNKLLLILHTMNRGGASKVMTLIANHYAEKGWEVTFIVQHAINLYKMDESINVISLGNERDYSKIKFVLYVRNFIKKNRPDIIVSFLLMMNILTIMASFGLKVKLVVSERNDPVKSEKKWQFDIAKVLYRIPDRIVFQSEMVKSYFSKNVQSKSLVIVNPIEIECKALEKRNKRIVNSGRLTSQKNQELLINAFSRIHAEFPEYTLTIYGEGELREKLENQIKTLGLGNNVFLPGNVTNIHESIADAEIFALSSDYEGLSNALLEALMMGLTCVSTKCAGSIDVIKDRENGLLVEIGSEDELYQGLKWLIKNPDEKKLLGINASETAQKYAKENILKVWEKVFNEMK